MKRFVFMLLVLVALVACGGAQRGGPPPAPATVAHAAIHATAHVVAVVSSDVAAQIAAAAAAPHAPGAIQARFGELVDQIDATQRALEYADAVVDAPGCAGRLALAEVDRDYALLLRLLQDVGGRVSADTAQAVQLMIQALDATAPACGDAGADAAAAAADAGG